MLNELKHPEGGAVTGVLSITKIDGKTGEVTEYPAQYNHITRWGLRAYNMGYRETPHRSGLVTGHRLGMVGLNHSIPPEDEVRAFSIRTATAFILDLAYLDPYSNQNVEPDKVGHVYKYAATYNRDEPFELSTFSAGWYNSTQVGPMNLPSTTTVLPLNSYWVPFNVITVRDAQARPSVITLNRGDKINLTYRLIIKQDPTQVNRKTFQYKGRSHTLTITTTPHTINSPNRVFIPQATTLQSYHSQFTISAVRETPKHDELPSIMMPIIPDNSEWRRKYTLRVLADTFISDNVPKIEYRTDGYLHTLEFNPPLSKGRGDVWEFSWITELHDRKTS